MRVTQGRTAFLDLQIAQKKLDQTLRTEIRTLTREYRGKLVAALRAPKKGRIYSARAQRRAYGKTGGFFGRRSVATKKYRASAPGEAPAVQTGTLLRSIRTKVGGKLGPFSARVFANRRLAFYRHFLEFGVGSRKIRRGREVRGKRRVIRERFGASSGSVAPRPVFSPLQAQLTRDLQQRVLKAVQEFKP